MALGPIPVFVFEFDVGDAVLVEGDGDVLGVDVVVVPGTQQHEVVQAGWSALAPVLDVVSFGPAGRFPTVGKNAPAIADYQRGSDLFGDDSGSSPDVEWFACWGGDDALNGRVAGELLGAGGADLGVTRTVGCAQGRAVAVQAAFNEALVDVGWVSELGGGGEPVDGDRDSDRGWCSPTGG